MRQALLFSLLFSFPALAALAEDAARTPDFSGAIRTQKLARLEGKRKVLAVLWDPKRPGHAAPSVAAIQSILFGERASVAGWFRENSNGRFAIESAGVLGWYQADKPGDHYWSESQGADPSDKDGDGWLNGHVEKWAEAIRKAARDVKLSAFDANKDGVLGPDELAVLVVIPQNEPFGTNRGPAGREAPKWEPLVVDGVQIPVIAEWYAGSPPNLGAPAHELCHLIFGAPDLYMTAPWPFAAARYSIMDCSYFTSHLDPFEKLKLGWVDWTAATSGGEHALASVESGGKVLVLHDPRRGPGEYFLVENRWRAGSYDAGVPGSGDGIPQDGLAVWHIVEDPALFAKAPAPTGGPDDWGRRGLRMIRRNGGTPVDDANALVAREGDGLDDTTGPARLVWLDGTRSGFSIKLLTPPGPTVRVRVGVRRYF